MKREMREVTLVVTIKGRAALPEGHADAYLQHLKNQIVNPSDWLGEQVLDDGVARLGLDIQYQSQIDGSDDRSPLPFTTWDDAPKIVSVEGQTTSIGKVPHPYLGAK